MRNLVLAFTIVPLVELSLIVLMAHFLGWPWALLITLFSSLLGAYLAVRSWRVWWREVQSEWRISSFPVNRLGEAGILLVSMAFLITPGPLTGILGLLMLVPSVRQKVLSWLLRKLKDRMLRTFIR